MIPEPQRTYVLELLRALGGAGNEFVVAGAQAMKFMLQGARATRDIDFVLNVIALRCEGAPIAATLKELGYLAVPGSQNFQFYKPILGSAEVMRIEFMAPEELKREKDFRVDVQQGLHARACTGGEIAIAQSRVYEIVGTLPDGTPYSAPIRVTLPHPLIMLKMLALDDRFRNIRGPAEARHDREAARTHAADIIAVLKVQGDLKIFQQAFEEQFALDPALGIRVLKIADEYFRRDTAPGLLVYEEQLSGDRPLDRTSRLEVARELNAAHRTMLEILPSTRFYQLIVGIEESCDGERTPNLVLEFLTNLGQAGVAIDSPEALALLPVSVFGGAEDPAQPGVADTRQVLEGLPRAELHLATFWLEIQSEAMRANLDLRARYPKVLDRTITQNAQ
jgi:hypothetical protein